MRVAVCALGRAAVLSSSLPAGDCPRAQPPVHLFSSPPLSSRTSISTCTISFPFPFAARSRITFTSSPLFLSPAFLYAYAIPFPLVPPIPFPLVPPFAHLVRLRAVPCRVTLIFSSFSCRCSISCFRFRFLIFLFLFCVPPAHRATFPVITRPQIAPISPPLSLPTSLPSSLVGFVFVVVSYYCRRRRGYRRQSSCCPVYIHTRVNSRSFAIALAILPFVRIAHPFCYIYMFWSSIVAPGPSHPVLPCPVPVPPIPFPILSCPTPHSATPSFVHHFPAPACRPHPRPRLGFVLVC